MDNDTNVIDQWLVSDKTARLSGLDIHPKAHPFMPDTVQSIKRGQGTVIYFVQPQHSNIWLIKKFAQGKRPDDTYLQAVPDHLPGSVAFYSTTQRRLLLREHLDRFGSEYRDPRLVDWIGGSILMPKVPGQPWSSIADNLRDGEYQLDITKRYQIALNLARCVEQLESACCSHRDLSGGNVFVDDGGRIYLIDCDCVYHRDLIFPTNTSTGTNGYIAPFLHRNGQDYDARASWCELADRFSLAILIAEFLLIDSETSTHEDGSLFKQDVLNHGDQSIDLAIKRLKNQSTGIARLFQQAIEAHDFVSCPTPSDWIGTLRHDLRYSNSKTQQFYVRHRCDNCGRGFRISTDRINELQSKSKPIYCRTCLQEYLDKASQKRHHHNLTNPQVNCEHCTRTIRLSRTKLTKLRVDGKPVLCRQCLGQQLKQWQKESHQREIDYPQVNCSQCGYKFRIHHQRLNELVNRNKKILCRNCFSSHNISLSKFKP